jgi:hypothetical protein
MRNLILPILVFTLAFQGCFRSASTQAVLQDFKTGTTLSSPGLPTKAINTELLPIFTNNNLIGWIYSAPDEIGRFHSKPGGIGFKEKVTGRTTTIFHVNMYSEVGSVVQSQDQQQIYFLWKRPGTYGIGFSYFIQVLTLQTLAVKHVQIDEQTYYSLRATSRR